MKKTERGFLYHNFEDHNGIKCSIQASSLADEEAIWFGADEIGLKHFKAHQGWNDVVLVNTISEHYIANNKMHLSRQQVQQLLPILIKFVETGELE